MASRHSNQDSNNATATAMATVTATATRVGPLDAFFAPRPREQFQTQKLNEEDQEEKDNLSSPSLSTNPLIASSSNSSSNCNNNKNSNNSSKSKSNDSITIPSIIVCLLPINDENEYEILNDKVLSRPVLTLTHVVQQHSMNVSATASATTGDSCNTLSLGRNDTTMIQEMSISRHLATLSIHDVEDALIARNASFKIILTINKNSKSHHVHVNGKHVQSTSIKNWNSVINNANTNTHDYDRNQASISSVTATATATAVSDNNNLNVATTSLDTHLHLDTSDSQRLASSSSSSSSAATTGTTVSLSAQSQSVTQSRTQALSQLTESSSSSEKPPSSQCVIELQHGDVISLYKNQYRYKLHCVNPNPITNENDGNSNNNAISAKIENVNINLKVEEGVSVNSIGVKMEEGEGVNPNLIKTEQALNSHSVKMEDRATTATSLKRKHGDITSKHVVQEEERGGEQAQEKEQQSSPPPPPPTSASSLLQHPLQIQAKQNILHELKCPICFEILIQATTTNSCGHLFCYDCIYPIYNVGGKKKKNGNRHRQNVNNNTNSKEKAPPCCPTCRHEIESLTRLRMYDDLIWNMVCLNQVFFTERNGNDNGNNSQDNEGRGDLEKYLERRGKSLEDLNQDEKECIFGSASFDAFDSDTAVATSSTATKNVTFLSPSQQRRLRRQERKMKRKNSPALSPIVMHNHDPDVNGIFDLTVLRQQQQQLGGEIYGGTQDDPILL